MIPAMNEIGAFFSVCRIHTKKRNHLEHKRLNDMVYVQYNLRLRHKQLLKKTLALGNITLDEFD